MSVDDNDPFDATDPEKIKNELKKESPLIPCNIWGYIKELEARIIELEKGGV